MELLFTSVNSRVIALIADVNNSKPLVGNSLWEEPACDNLTHTCTHKHSLASLPLFIATYSYKLCILPSTHIFICMSAQ